MSPVSQILIKKEVYRTISSYGWFPAKFYKPIICLVSRLFWFYIHFTVSSIDKNEDKNMPWIRFLSELS